MIVDLKRPIPVNLTLLTTTNNYAEYEIISGMLDANGIDVYVLVEGASNVPGLLVAPIPQYSFYVHFESLSDARNLLLTTEQSDDREWREYRQQLAKGRFGGRIVGIIAAVFFLVLAFLPMKESDDPSRYVLIGISFLLLLAVIFSFEKK